MLNIKICQDSLLRAMGEKLVRFGFASRPRTQSFLRQTPFGFEVFHISFIRHPEDFDLTADVAIRIDKLEEMINQEEHLLSKAEKRKTATIGAELGNISHGEQKRWTIKKDRDIEGIASEIMIDFASIAIPYFKKYLDQDEVYRVLSDNTRSGWLHCPFHESRCKSAVGLGYLLEKSDLAALISRNDAFLQGRNDPGLAGYRKFIEQFRG